MAIVSPTPFAAGYLALESVAFRRLNEGDLLGALAAFRRAAELAELRRDHEWRGRMLRHMAGLYQEEGAPQLAVSLAEEALRCFARSGRPVYPATTGTWKLEPPASPMQRSGRPGALRSRVMAAVTTSALLVSPAALADGDRCRPAVDAAAPVSCDRGQTAVEAPANSLPPGISEEQRLLGYSDSSLVPTGTSPTLAAPEGCDAEVGQPGAGLPSEAADRKVGAAEPGPSIAAPAEPRSDAESTRAGTNGEGPGDAPSSPPPPSPALSALSVPTADSAAPLRPPAGHTRSLAVPRVKTPPVIDGRLDDPGWKEAARATGFWVSETEHAPREATEVYVAADAETLYFAFRCHAAEPGAVSATQTKRDADFGFDDAVTVQLDAYHNHRQISEFSVNALGTQADAMAGGRARKIEWKGDWKGAAVRTADGWTAELAIPFRILNYTPGADTFGVNFVRYHHRAQETSRWADVTPAFRTEEMGHLTGLRPPHRSAPPLSMMTYTTGGLDAPNRAGRSRSFLAGSGLDLRYSPSNNLTSMTSLYPDFSQVEQQVTDVGFSYNEKFVADHRPFFQEGGGFFGANRTFFHSGRIPDFDAGGKLFGRLGTTQIGFMGVESPGGRQDYVARAVRELGPRSSVALMAVGTERSQVSNQLFALEANARSARGLTLNLNVAGTHTRGGSGDGSQINLGLGRETPYLQFGVAANRTGTHFFPADGFMAGDQLGTIGGSAYASYSREYAGRSIRQLGGDLTFSNRDTLTGLLQNRNVSADVSVETRSQRQFTLSYSAGPYRPVSGTAGVWSKNLNHDQLFATSLYFNTRSSRGGYGLTYAWGNQGGGRYSDLAPSFWWHPSPRASISYSFERAFSFGSTQQSVLSATWDLNAQEGIGVRWVDYQGQGYWRVAFRRAVTRGIDVYAVFNREPGIAHRFVVKLVRSLR